MSGMFEYVAFNINNQKYAVPLASVVRVVRAVEVTALPKTPEVIMGIINIEGRIVPVFDLHRRFGLSERKVDVNDRFIVTETPKRRVALRVDSVNDVVKISIEDVIHAERVLQDLEYVSGVVKLENGLILIFDVASFLSLDEEQQLDNELASL